MMQNPAAKYHAFRPVNLVNRNWPNRTITQPPIWMSTDLRDGNQALFEPMNAEKKMRMFKTLCAIGFKEIEIAFPSASETEFGFVRKLIEGGHIPDDVTIEVLTQAREHLIRRTFESIKGAKQAIVHVYNATCKTFRDNVFGMSKAEVVQMAVDAVRLIRELADAMPETTDHARIQPRALHRHRARFRQGSLRRRHRRLGRDAAAQGHPQSPDHGRDRHAQHLRRPDRVDAQATSPAATASSSASTRTMTAAPPSPPPNSASWPAPTASRAAFSATASAPATSISSPSPSTCTRRASIPASIFPTSTPSPALSNTAPSSRSIRATHTSGISSSRPSPAPTRMPSRRGLPLKRRTSNGRCPISRSTRPTSAAATTR